MTLKPIIACILLSSVAMGQTIIRPTSDRTCISGYTVSINGGPWNCLMLEGAPDDRSALLQTIRDQEKRIAELDSEVINLHQEICRSWGMHVDMPSCEARFKTWYAASHKK